MCQTFFYNGKQIATIGELKSFCSDVQYCMSDHARDSREPKDTDCLCDIDPIYVAMKTDMVVICDPNREEYSFSLRDSG